MTWLLQLSTRVGDALAAPLAGHPAWLMVVWAVVFGAVALVLFKLATPQQRLAAARDRLIGHLLEAALFQSSLVTILKVQGRLLVANLRYLVLALPALVAIMVPLLLVLPQLEVRFGRRALEVGEAALVTAQMASPADIALEAAPGLVIEAGPVRDSERGELVWRIRAEAPGRHPLRLLGDGMSEVLDVSVGEAGMQAVPMGRHRSFLDRLLFDPGSRPLPAGSPVQRLAVAMPHRETSYLGMTLPWLVAFTILSLVAGLALKKPLRVEM